MVNSSPAAEHADSPSPGFRDEKEELKQRFLAALSKSNEPLTDVMEWQRLVALKYIERDLGLQLGVDRAIEASAVKVPDLKLAFHLETPKGLRKLYPDISKLSFDSAAQTFNHPQMRTDEYGMLGFLLLTMKIADECRPGEPVYNKKFVKQVAAQPWKAKGSEVAQYSLYFRMLDHKCLSEKDFKIATDPLMPAIRRMLAADHRMPADTSGLLFLLSASGRFEALDRKNLLRFVRTQTADGTWANDTQREYASMNAAMGAYVIARILQESKTVVSNADVAAARARGPVLPESTYKLKPVLP